MRMQDTLFYLRFKASAVAKKKHASETTCLSIKPERKTHVHHCDRLPNLWASCPCHQSWGVPAGGTERGRFPTKAFTNDPWANLIRLSFQNPPLHQQIKRSTLLQRIRRIPEELHVQRGCARWSERVCANGEMAPQFENTGPPRAPYLLPGSSTPLRHASWHWRRHWHPLCCRSWDRTPVERLATGGRSV